LETPHNSASSLLTNLSDAKHQGVSENQVGKTALLFKN